MSSERSSSAVRNLRSLFENKATDDPTDARGRSPGNLGIEGENQRPRSRVRASFFHVTPAMASTSEEAETSGRRGSFSIPASDNLALEQVKSAVSEGREDAIKAGDNFEEVAVASAVATPIAEAAKEIGNATGELTSRDKPGQNPDKLVTAAEEEPATIKPANPSDAGAVSGGEALPPANEDQRESDAVPKLNGGAKHAVGKKTAASKGARPSAISTKESSTKPIKSPNQLKPPAPSVDAVRKPSRSSLAAPTAASAARAAAADRAPASIEKSTPKPKPREATKPLEVSSRLIAPTAASRAKHEAPAASTTSKGPATTQTKTKPASTRPTPRSSLAGPTDSQSSAAASRKSHAPLDGSFLDRMTKPTAASAQRAHEKPETKIPPKQKSISARPKTNGHAKPAEPASKAAETSSTDAETGDQAVEEPLVDTSDETAAPASNAEATVQEAKVEPLVLAEPAVPEVESKLSSEPAGDLAPREASAEPEAEKAAVAESAPVTTVSEETT